MFLIAVLLPLCSRTTLLNSFCHFALFIVYFSSSPFFPVNSNIDPHVIVLNLSFMWFISLSFIMILFEEIIDVIFPSLF